MTKRIIGLLILAGCLAMTGCGEGGSQKECEMDGDCPAHWRCDIYAFICRCVSDEGCDQVAGEVCMPDGTCQVYTGCTSDAMCPSLWRCEVSTGECLCTSDEACGVGEVCNSSGFCQPSAGCFDNDDCAAGEFCDTPTKTCVPVGTCTTKFQCPIGNLCSGGQCVPGCEDYGDCPLRSGCINGQCMQGVCEDDSFCEFMYYCDNGNCLNAYSANTPYCKPCDGQNLLDCGVRGNPCLIYPFDPPEPFAQVSDEYCSVDCSGGQRCPNGFTCNSIITVKQTDLCRSDAECPGSLPCLKSQEEDQGFCPCHNTQNRCMANTCLQNMCGTFTGTCLLLDLPCQTDADCYMCSVTTAHCATDADCATIECELYDGVDYGGCVSARGCGLDEGYHCPPP
jgi:hypothetical protein